MISKIKHENLVQLYGCCVEGNHRILVYNYLENNSLAQTLLGNFIFLLLLKNSLLYKNISIGYFVCIISLFRAVHYPYYVIKWKLNA